MTRVKTTEAALLITGLLMGGCSQTIAVENSAAPAGYEQLIADGETAKSLRSRLALMEPLEVSPLRPSVLTQPGDWTACVKVVSHVPKQKSGPSDASGADAVQRPPLPGLPPQGPVMVSYYAIFFRSGKIAESRRSVVIDHCDQLQYSPLPKASKPKSGSKSDT